MSQDVPTTPQPGDDNPFMPRRSRSAKPEAWVNSAAVYVRMSTEHQQYSTSNQMDVIREYAKKHGLEIVKIFSDDGKSGLNLGGRGSLMGHPRLVQSEILQTENRPLFHRLTGFRCHPLCDEHRRAGASGVGV